MIEIERFLRTNQTALAARMEQAYARAGGHYAAMTPAQRRRQAQIDSGDFIESLLKGTIDRAEVQEIARDTAAGGIAVEDVLRMSEALETLCTTFVQQEMQAQPELAVELVRRIHNVTTSFRANLTVANLDAVLRRLQPPS